MTMGRNSALHIHFSYLLGDRALSQYNSCTQMMGLKKLFCDTGEDLTLHIHCSGLLETALS